MAIDSFALMDEGSKGSRTPTRTLDGSRRGKAPMSTGDHREVIPGTHYYPVNVVSSSKGRCQRRLDVSFTQVRPGRNLRG